MTDSEKPLENPFHDGDFHGSPGLMRVSSVWMYFRSPFFIARLHLFIDELPHEGVAASSAGFIAQPRKATLTGIDLRR